MSTDIEVQIACTRPRLASKLKVQAWAQEALRGRADEHQLTVRVVDEAEGTRLNEDYRRCEGATNVLSFPFDSPPGVDDCYLGDIAVCAPVVAQEAKQQGKSREAHFAHLVVHGTLHLLGHDHQNSEEATRMESEEVAILGRLGYPDPYAPYSPP